MLLFAEVKDLIWRKFAVDFCRKMLWRYFWHSEQHKILETFQRHGAAWDGLEVRSEVQGNVRKLGTNAPAYVHDWECDGALWSKTHAFVGLISSHYVLPVQSGCVRLSAASQCGRMTWELALLKKTASLSPSSISFSSLRRQVSSAWFAILSLFPVGAVFLHKECIFLADFFHLVGCFQSTQVHSSTCHGVRDGFLTNVSKLDAINDNSGGRHHGKGEAASPQIRHPQRRGFIVQHQPFCYVRIWNDPFSPSGRLINTFFALELLWSLPMPTIPPVRVIHRNYTSIISSPPACPNMHIFLSWKSNGFALVSYGKTSTKQFHFFGGVFPPFGVILNAQFITLIIFLKRAPFPKKVWIWVWEMFLGC